MEISLENLEKFRQEIAKALGAEILPAQADYLLEYRAKDLIKAEVWRDLLLLLTDSRLRDTSNLPLGHKMLLLDTLRLNLIRANQPLDRTLFKTIKEKLLRSKEILLDIQDVLNYQKTQKEKYKTVSLRKYGPVKGGTFKNQLRENFAQALQSKNFTAALEIILQVRFRKITGITGVAREYLDRVQVELLTVAGELQLDIAKLKKSFLADLARLNLSYEPLDPKKYLIIE
ncbi:hypothetical protein NO1_1972 [Candidatus Termititenax aidoneus]|uniref:Uncharacterized protein n=1 Tax=Termititenax aidoneus TaxID=2218524 RepID=A0A388TE38_TERA1|nr:hypothetical protein NO1_1972 [Candidatus Termititenax aidoneus]